MKELNFKTQYSVVYYFRLTLSFILTIFFILLVFEDNLMAAIFVAVLGFVPLMAILFFHIKKIVFNENSFSVQKFIGPVKVINYVDVVDIGLNTIKTKKGNILLRDMKNRKELRKIFKKFLEQGTIDREQIEGKLENQEINSIKAYIPALIISSVLSIIVVIILPFKIGDFANSLLFFGLFFPIFYILYSKFAKSSGK
ncbi:MAG: hypothetical protein HPY85_09745 [Anaerolineae bacterium]|nr:hypothetical protein [Anaerolineae bacterium]